MKLRFFGETDELETGIAILSSMLGFASAEDGLPVEIRGRTGGIEAGRRDGRGWIAYQTKASFFRALGLFLETAGNGGDFHLREEPQFRTVGVMVDASRNAVPKTETVKRLLCLLALMGYNMLMLYTEDTYGVQDEPYFGYMRGRYSEAELREMDDYAELLGIEMIPCIQTLGHLEQFLKWEPVKGYRDTDAILLPGDERTYTLIERMVEAAARPFRSRRIHLGMDEASGVGLGRYLELNGYKDRYALMIEHMQRVVHIAEARGLKPMIWGDMPFRLGSKHGTYPDPGAVIPPEMSARLPHGLQYVYWDYMTTSRETYRRVIRQHRAMGCEPIYAGTAWNYCGYCTNIGRAFATLEPALSACKDEGVGEAFITLWNDNGAENSFYSPLPVLQYFAEACHTREDDGEKLVRRFRFCAGADFHDLSAPRYLDETPLSLPQNMDSSNPSKFLLWQDPLLGLFDRHVENHDLPAHYAGLQTRLNGCRERNPGWESLFDVSITLCEILKRKCDLGLRIKTAYGGGDREKLREIAVVELPALGESVEKLRLLHRAQWFDTYKPFGWEVLDIRYGGLKARLDSASGRLLDYIEGRADRIQELEEERLYFEDPEACRDIGYSVFNRYHRIVTAGAFSN